MNAEAVLNEVRKSRRYLVAGHVDPDGDAVASVLLAGKLLSALGKDYVLYLHDPVPSKFGFLSGTEKIAHNLPSGDFDTVIILDTPDLKRLGVEPPQSRIINIDHHPSNTGFGDVNWLETDRTAACLMVLELVEKAGVPFGKEEGEMVFTGLYTETGGFTYPNVSAEAFERSAELLRMGVDASDIALRITSRNARNLELLGSVLNTLKIEQGVATIELTERMLKEAGIRRAEQDSDSFIRYPASIPGVKIAIFLRENGEEDEVRLSFRSVKEVDVDKLAARFGGGGHRNAAGARIKGNFAEVKRMVVEEAKGYLECAEA